MCKGRWDRLLLLVVLSGGVLLPIGASAQDQAAPQPTTKAKRQAAKSK